MAKKYIRRSECIRLLGPYAEITPIKFMGQTRGLSQPKWAPLSNIEFLQNKFSRSLPFVKISKARLGAQGDRFCHGFPHPGIQGRGDNIVLSKVFFRNQGR